MKQLLRRFLSNRRVQQVDVDLEHLAPMAHLIEDEEPDPQLFARIEASIDAEIAAASQQTSDRSFGGLTVILALLAGIALGAISATFLQPRQHISAQKDADGAGVHLGSVVVRGAPLRAFLRAQCEGQTHLWITVRASQGEMAAGRNSTASLQPAEPQKFRMSCIF